MATPQEQKECQELKESMNLDSNPPIIFLPHPVDTDDILSMTPIIVTDLALYKRMVEGIQQALNTDRPGVIVT